MIQLYTESFLKTDQPTNTRVQHPCGALSGSPQFIYYHSPPVTEDTSNNEKDSSHNNTTGGENVKYHCN